MSNNKNILLCLFFAVHIKTVNTAQEAQPNIFAAVNANDIGALRRIVEANPHEIHAQDCLRGTPLHLAAFHGHYGIVHYLIRHGAHVNTFDNWQDTPLHRIVAQSPDKQDIYTVLALLINKGSDVDAQNIRGITPVHKAAMRCHLGYIKQLLLAGAYTDIQDHRGRTPLYRTLKEESENWLQSYRERCEVIKYLLEFGVTLESEANLLRQRLVRYTEVHYDFAQIINRRRQFWLAYFPSIERFFLGEEYEQLQLPDDLRRLLVDFIATSELR